MGGTFVFKQHEKKTEKELPEKRRMLLWKPRERLKEEGWLTMPGGGQDAGVGRPSSHGHSKITTIYTAAIDEKNQNTSRKDLQLKI